MKNSIRMSTARQQVTGWRQHGSVSVTYCKRRRNTSLCFRSKRGTLVFTCSKKRKNTSIDILLKETSEKALSGENNPTSIDKQITGTVSVSAKETPSTSKGIIGNEGSLLKWKTSFRGTLRRLSSLKLAIGEIAVIAMLSALGTLLEQHQSPEYYTHLLNNQLLGEVSGLLILLLGLDHMYTSPVYLGMCILLTSSLMACSYTRQWPMIRVARRWSYISKASRFDKLTFVHKFPMEKDSKKDIFSASSALGTKGYKVFEEGKKLYAYKGLLGKYAPIGVHISIVLIILGASISATCGWHGNLFISEEGEAELYDYLRPNSVLARSLQVEGQKLRLNKFDIKYYPDGNVEQFYSDLTITDNKGIDKYSKVISVNDPFRYGSITAYQTDWGIVGVQIGIENKIGEGFDNFEVVIPMVSLEGKLSTSGKIWGGVLPIIDSNGGQSQATIVARDLQNVAIYDNSGAFKGIIRPGSKRSLDLGPASIKVTRLISSSGLELKSDPGVPTVYAGFGFLMVTTALSYISHSQVWALEDLQSGQLLVGGTTNRAKREFQNELESIASDIKS